MTAADVLDGLIRVNLAASAAILGVIALRRMVRRPFGGRLAYGLWLLPVLAGAAVLAPARQLVIVPPPAPAFRPATQFRLAPALAQIHRPPAASGMQPTAQAPLSPASTMGVDPRALLLGLWLLGAGGTALVMAGLQQRFVSQERRGAVGPAVVGVIAPRIVMPKDFGDRYSRDEQVLVLAHEQAHIARHDSRLNGLCAGVQCLCWFNPLVHLAARLMRVDQELACDEAVVTRFPAARRAYAEVLLKAQLAILPLPLGCYWPSSSRHPLVERVALLKDRVISPARRWAGASALAILCTGAGLAAWATQPADVRIRIATPAPSGRAAQLVPATAVAAAASETSAPDNGPTGQTPDQAAVPTLPLKVAAGDGPADQTPAAAAAPPRADDSGTMGPIDVTGDTIYLAGGADHHLATYRGNVEAVIGGARLLSDVLNIYFSDKRAEGATAIPTSGAVQINWGTPQLVQAEGHVTFASADKTAKADQAVYDRALNTITLSGNVVLVQGGKESSGESLVIDLKTNHAAMSDADGNASELVPHPAV